MPTVETDIVQILNKIDNKLDKLETKVEHLETKVETKLEQLETKLETKLEHLETEMKQLETKLGTEMKQLETKIDSKLEKVVERLSKVEVGQAELKGEIKTVFTAINENNKRLDDTNARLNTVTIGFLSLIGVILISLISFIVKFIDWPMQ